MVGKRFVRAALRTTSLAVVFALSAAAVAPLPVSAATPPAGPTSALFAWTSGVVLPAESTVTSAPTTSTPGPTTSTPVPTSTPPAAIVPTSSRIASAERWIEKRKGVVAFAVMDSAGHLWGYHMNERFVTASVVKAMLLLAYLRSHTSLSPWARSTLTKMIHVSDNSCATAIYDIVGNSGLRRLAKAAGMRRFSVTYSWGRAQLTPADQARYFFNMDKLTPSKYRTFVRHLLSHITSSQSWGIPAVARRHGWVVFFKGGWRGTSRGQLVHQIARLETKKAKFSVAIMTDGDPSMSYGIATIAGVTQRLLGLAP